MIIEKLQQIYISLEKLNLNDSRDCIIRIYKNTQPHTLGCKIGCKPYKTLIVSVDCGAGGK